jgi:hypothetical protein
VHTHEENTQQLAPSSWLGGFGRKTTATAKTRAEKPRVARSRTKRRNTLSSPLHHSPPFSIFFLAG